jgi:hypothetical protein
MQERLTMSHREIDRLKVIEQVLRKQLRGVEAAEQLSVSTRQVSRLCARVRDAGNRGIIHRLRGRASNHQLAAGLLEEALGCVRQHYVDFGPTLANEKLRDRHGLKLSTERLRQGMMQAGLWKGRRRKPKHRQWRPRRSCVGQLIQLDGSEHAWFEDRGPKCVLVLYIDDASSRILYGEFVKVEDTLTLLRTTRAYLKRWGRPIAFYVDKDSIYRVNRQATIEEQLRGSEPLTQFTRAMSELDIEVIPAHSPQAKGRVERSFRTHQDRLVKELRLLGISDRDAANGYLRRRYIPRHNARFACEAANATDAHRPLLKTHDLKAILSVQTQRQVACDYTLRLNNRFFQILKVDGLGLRPKQMVLVEQRLDGSMRVRFKGRYLAFKAIAKRAQRAVVGVLPATRRRPLRPVYPPMEHPFKAASYQAMLRPKAFTTQATSKQDIST